MALFSYYIHGFTFDLTGFVSILSLILGFILARFMGKEGIYVAIVIMNIILIILEKLGEVVAKKS